MKKTISNKALIFRIIVLMLFLSVSILFISTEYLKKTAVDNLASDDAKKTAQLVFETINTRMQEGWTKGDLDKIIDRLHIIRKGMDINSYRSPQVEELFGVVPGVHEKIASDPMIQKAMKGEEIFYVDEETGMVRFLYPMIAKNECIHCHVNVKDGSVNGVLDITFPQSDIKISLDSITFYMITFFVIFLLLMAYLFYTIVNKKMVEPIVKLTNNIQEIEQSKDLDRTVQMDTNISELNILQNSFNSLLTTIKYYYAKMIESIYRDKLTGIYNLTKLQEDLEQSDTKKALLSFDIRALGMINRVYGYSVADILIQQFATTMQEIVKEKGTLYRLYGDEFAVAYDTEVSLDEIHHILQQLKNHKFIYKDREFILDVTLGFVNSFTKNSLEKANIALKFAKTNKKNIYEYNDTLAVKDEDNNHINWLKKLEIAIDNDQLVPYFMPMKNTKTGKIDKYETLIRIDNGEEVYTPYHFMEIAVASGKYQFITQTVIQKTFEYFKNKKDLKFSINLSLSDITNIQTMELLYANLEKFEHSHNVILELLETEELSDYVLLNNFIKNVKKYDVKVAIDDFGSGYSNYNYILNLDIDIIKLDSSLVENIYTDQESLVIVLNIVRTAKEIGLIVVAEKVSDEHIEKILTVHEVDYLQGFHIGKPAPAVLD